MKKIVVIDDEPDIRKVLTIVLKNKGYDVYSAGTAEEGLLTIKRILPDLIFLDVILPGMSGFELCRIIRQDAILKDTPVVLVSALGRDSDKKLAKEAGAQLYVKKPFSNKDIEKIARYYVGKKNEKTNNSKADVLHDLLHAFQQYCLITKGKIRLDKFYEVLESTSSLNIDEKEFTGVKQAFDLTFRKSFGHIEKIKISEDNKSDVSRILVDVNGCRYAKKFHKNLDKSNYTCPVVIVVGYLVSKLKKDEYALTSVLYQNQGSMSVFSRSQTPDKWIRIVTKAADTSR